MKKDTKTYYLGVNKTTNKVKIGSSMQSIATHLGINAVTIRRHLGVIPWYECDEYVIGKCIGIQRVKRGFGRIK